MTRLDSSQLTESGKMRVNVILFQEAEEKWDSTPILSSLVEVPEGTDLEQYANTVNKEFKETLFNQFSDEFRTTHPNFVADQAFFGYWVEVKRSPELVTHEHFVKTASAKVDSFFGEDIVDTMLRNS